MQLDRTALPGVGVSHALTTHEGKRLGVVARLDGRHDLLFYDPAEPDAAACVVSLDAAEAHTIADLLQATVTLDHLAELERTLDGVHAVRIRLAAGSPYADRPLGDTRARTLTGASIVAVIRAGKVLAAPGPELVLRVGDLIVAVGDESGTSRLKDLLVPR